VDDEELVRRAAATTPDALCLFGLDGEVRWCNQAFADLVGRPIEDLPGTPGRELGDDDGRLQFDDHVEQMRRRHPGARDEEVLMRRPDGTVVWCLASWWPVRDDDGEVAAYLHQYFEYTRRRRALDRLRADQAKLEHAQRIAMLGSWSWHLGSGTVWWSDSMYGIHGVDPETFEPTWDSFVSLLHPDDRDQVTSTVLDALNTLDRYTYETRVTVHGAVRWLRGVGEIHRDDDSRVDWVTGTVQDVTELRAAHETAAQATDNLLLLQQLAEAANRSTTLADALVRSAQLLAERTELRPLCVFVRHERGAELTPLKLPEPAAPDLPAPDPEIAERSWRRRQVDISPAAGRPDLELITLPVSGGRTMACVVQVVGPAGATPWPLVRQAADQLSRVAERERTTQQLSEARDEAMAASRHKSDFLATMSHEIRTPMNGVVGLTDLLLRTDLDDQQRRLAEALRGSGLTLLALINDILDLSKVESGKLELEAIEFEVRTVVEETVLVLAGPAQDKGLDLRVGIDPDVPRLLRGDPVRLGQVLTNLGSNAVKFTAAGEVVVDVRTVDAGPEAADGEVLLRVEVRDTGIGITDEQRERLFEAFTQADRSTTRQHGGTGLGLAICRQLVEQMGGEIGVRSAPGTGSAFWFTARLGAVPADGVSHLDRPLRRRRVLVVADDPATASSLTRQLTAWQLQVDQTRSATTALTMLGGVAEGSPYDVVLVALAEAEAVDLGRAVGGLRATVDLVLVADDDVDRQAVGAAGFRSVVRAPVRASELYRALLEAAEPVPTTATTTAAITAATPAPPGARSADLGLHVLVVEDNAVNQLVATGLLENLGCTVTAVGNGAEAVDLLDGDHDVDLVLMDCRMPRMDGFDATRVIRARERDGRVPIIAMTASALPGERERCLAAGMDDFLTKPVDPAQLAAAVARAGSGRVGSRAGSRPAAPVPQQPASAATPVLDPDRVEMLGELVKDGVSFFERARMSFLSRVDGSLAQINIAVQDGDAERAVADAHQLKGSALNLGLNRVGAAAEAIEELARTGTLAGADLLLEALRDAVTEGVEALAAVERG
jgi:two-component system, sensor histidine kinase and response regulator